MRDDRSINNLQDRLIEIIIKYNKKLKIIKTQETKGQYQAVEHMVN